MENIIEAQTVTKIYQTRSLTVRAVDQVQFTIKPGEFVALVGPSGSGKTTMLAILAALLTPTEGSVSIDGQDLSKLSDNARVRFRRERIGFTFQSNNLLPYLTVIENVELLLRLNKRMDKAGHNRALELIDRLGLKDRINSLPNQLSGGQKQRVAIARSLIHNPSVVLADEPTASLDSERAFQVVRIFADLIHEQKRAGIMVSHDLRMCAFVDRVIQMQDGRVVSTLNSRSEIDEFIACA